MAESTIVKTKRDGTITIEDGTSPTPQSYTVAFEAGDLSIAIPGRTVNLYLDRGVMTSPPAIRYGDDTPMTGSFTAQFRESTDAAVEALTDFLTLGGFVGASWVSRGGANAEVQTFRITWELEGTDHGDASDHSIACDHCVISGSIADGDPVTLSLSFTSYDLYPTVS